MNNIFFNKIAFIENMKLKVLAMSLNKTQKEETHSCETSSAKHRKLRKTL